MKNKESEKELEWGNLTMYMCPKCAKELEEKGDFFICKCGFKISSKRYDEIVAAFTTETIIVGVE